MGETIPLPSVVFGNKGVGTHLPREIPDLKLNKRVVAYVVFLNLMNKGQWTVCT